MAVVDTVVSAKIHPAIGVARVGNSDEFFVGPELPYPAAPPKGGYKDAGGKLKRQAARFRIYGYDKAGKVVAELTAANAVIAWQVHVANKKAAWYDFRFALDLFPPDSPQWLSEVATRRNVTVTGDDRKKLTIDPGAHAVSGAKAKPVALEGAFFDKPVYLGELRTDEDGRLLFLGGRGVSESLYGDTHPIAFANSPGWHDDTSDGPVHATVRIGKKQIPVDAAWVVTAPPNYAPDIVSPQTMYDVIYDANIGTNTWGADVEKPSFTKHILPVFQQLTDTQWVNYGFFVRHGWRAPYDFGDESLLRKLAAPKTQHGDDVYAELRREIYYQFRQPGSPSSQEPPFRWPPIYGDAEGSFQSESRAMFTYTATILKYLAAWRDGNFEADYDPAEHDARPKRFADVPLAEQPEILDRSALHWCMGGPFHPGCEMTWIVRQPMMYRSAWRFRERPANLAEPDYGEVITPSEVLGDTGPLASSGPGDISKWMAVPWQTDTASCQSGYEAGDSYLPSFWPSRVPNHVLTEEDYARVIDVKL
ncbi:MAG TPA: LodA/GoxA family CTQ-dependent oxidase, partial [Candidatus Elarobacter sp.]